MAIYAIGDVQGCFEELLLLLKKIDFQPRKDRLWFVGDLVNRGPASLDTLRYVRNLGDRATVVLGNHDLHLLALAEGCARRRNDDTLDEVLSAPDRESLIGWLRARPLLHREEDYILVHAGLLPQWSSSTAEALASEVQTELRGPRYRDFLSRLYGSKPDRWSEDLLGMDRWRMIVNAMTRMRFCSAEGVLEFQTKGDAGAAPPGFLPWFDVAGRLTAGEKVVYGHWSALGLRIAPGLIGLDSGCVWGGQLTAIRLGDHELFQVECRNVNVPVPLK